MNGTDQKVLGHFPKSTTASVQVSLMNCQGSDYVDIREVIPSTGEQSTHTKKGIRIKADLEGGLAELLREAQGLIY